MTEEGVTEERLDQRRLLKLVIGWAFAVLLPGIITINQPVILAYVVWGIGFFVALALFIAAAKMTQTTELWPWLAASTLPWVVNLSVPDNPMYIPVYVVGAGLLAAWIYLRAVATDRLLHEGVEGTGTVIEVIEPRAISAAANTGYVRRSIRLSVERPDKTKTYEAVLRDLYKLDELPSPGDTIALRIDPEDATRVAATPVERAATEPASTPDAEPHEDELSESP